VKLQVGAVRTWLAFAILGERRGCTMKASALPTTEPKMDYTKTEQTLTAQEESGALPPGRCQTHGAPQRWKSCWWKRLARLPPAGQDLQSVTRRSVKALGVNRVHRVSEGWIKRGGLPGAVQSVRSAQRWSYGDSMVTWRLARDKAGAFVSTFLSCGIWV
jgi:hypothetical protein